MSASEKLRALKAQRDERVSAVSPMYAQAWLAAEFERALPLIADVVEAAEAIAEPNDYWDWVTGYAPRCKAALTALQEHLEGEA